MRAVLALILITVSLTYSMRLERIGKVLGPNLEKTPINLDRIEKNDYLTNKQINQGYPMTLEQIKKALAEGKRVFWSNKGYEVIKDNIGQYLIIWDKGGKGEYCIGLTWRDGVTLNGKEDQFFTSL